MSQRTRRNSLLTDGDGSKTETPLKVQFKTSESYLNGGKTKQLIPEGD